LPQHQSANGDHLEQTAVRDSAANHHPDAIWTVPHNSGAGQRSQKQLPAAYAQPYPRPGPSRRVGAKRKYRRRDALAAFATRCEHEESGEAIMEVNSPI